MTNALDMTIGAVLQQQIMEVFKLKPAEIRFSTFDHEHLAVYLPIKHFVEGHDFHDYRSQATDFSFMLPISEIYT